VLAHNTLNAFIALGKPITNGVRERIAELLNVNNQELQGNDVLKSKALIKQSDAQMLMPVQVPNYTDFYSSREHATNVGMMFRDPANALLPNWLHLPVGYHGRASSIVVPKVRLKQTQKLCHLSALLNHWTLNWS
jgi:fumarylacetoacetase